MRLIMFGICTFGFIRWKIVQFFCAFDLSNFALLLSAMLADNLSFAANAYENTSLPFIVLSIRSRSEALDAIFMEACLVKFCGCVHLLYKSGFCIFGVMFCHPSPILVMSFGLNVLL